MSKELQSNVSFSHFVEINPTFVEESLFVISAQPLCPTVSRGAFSTGGVSPCPLLKCNDTVAHIASAK